MYTLLGVYILGSSHNQYHFFLDLEVFFCSDLHVIKSLLGGRGEGREGGSGRQGVITGTNVLLGVAIFHDLQTTVNLYHYLWEGYQFNLELESIITLTH